ncbi:MAG: HAD hydrolase-like protein, partial [Candidatus Fimenecus sp.]
ENSMYEGIPETLTELKKRGYVLATASSKPLKFVNDICENLDIKKYFDYLGGTAFDNTSESKAVVIEKAMSEIGALKSNTLMVGDRLFDIDGAHTVGIPCCAVLYGFGSREEFLEHKAEYIVEKPSDILEIV